MSDESRLLALTEIGPSSFHTAMLSMRDGTLNARVRNAWTPSLSPDGRWLAYTSNEAGRYEIYVRPTSGAEGRWQISVTSSTFAHGKPRKLFEGRYRLGEVKDDARAYDVAPDAERFLMLKPEGDLSTAGLKAVVNWHRELEQLVPTRSRM